MTLPSSPNEITLADIAIEFDAPEDGIELSDFYAGGSYVPTGATGDRGAIPSSGNIEVGDFWGASNITIKTYTMGAAAWSSLGFGYKGVWNGNYGTLSPNFSIGSSDETIFELKTGGFTGYEAISIRVDGHHARSLFTSIKVTGTFETWNSATGTWSNWTGTKTFNSSTANWSQATSGHAAAGTLKNVTNWSWDNNRLFKQGNNYTIVIEWEN